MCHAYVHCVNMFCVFVSFFMHLLTYICRLNLYLHGDTNMILESYEHISVSIKSNLTSFIQGNDIENVFGKMAVILALLQCVSQLFTCMFTA